MATPDSPEEQQKIERLRQAMYSRTLSEQLKARERRTLDLTHEVVGDDFHHPEETLPTAIIAPRGMSIARTALWWLLGIAIIFFICALGFFAYYFTLGGGALTASPSNIDIAVSGPPQVQGGGVTKLQVVVTNRNSVPLQLADLIVTFPSGTRSAADFSTAEPTLQQSLGTIAPGASVQGEIPAVFAGTAGQEADVKLELEYHLAGSNSIFTASSDYAITFGSSPLSIGVDGNSETVSGQPIEFTVNVASNATAPVTDTLLSVDYPFGFTFTSASPAPASPGLWNLVTLNPGDTRSITLQGVLTGDPGDQRTFNFVAGTRDSTSSSEITTQLANLPYQMSITSSFLGLGISVNGASSSVTVSPSNPVVVSINYENDLPTAIQNAVIVAQLNGVQIDGTTVLSQDGFYNSSNDSMLWDKTTTNGALATIAPGAKGTLKFTFEAPTTAMLTGVTNPKLVISLSAAGQRTDQTGVPQNLQAAISQTIGIASDLEFAAQGLYYSNPFGSTGPIPPQAGTETTYGIIFTITNTTNEITDAKLTALLPPYIRWLERWYPAPATITLNSDNSTMTWDIGDIPPGVGLNGTPPLQAGIAIGFTPSTSQIGSQPTLIQNITLSGIDTAKAATLAAGGNTEATSSATVHLTVPDVTTNLSQVSESSAGIVINPDPGFVPENATVSK
jgi:hypothetical protein